MMADLPNRTPREAKGGYVTPAVERAGLLHFDTGGRYWTPEWDFEHGAGKTVVGCITADGEEHRFDETVSAPVARAYQRANGGENTVPSTTLKAIRDVALSTKDTPHG